MSKVKYYGVTAGREVGVFDNWEECKSKVNGYSGASYVSFDTYEEAYNYVYGEKAVDALSYDDIFTNVDDICIDGKSFSDSCSLDDAYDYLNRHHVCVSGSFKDGVYAWAFIVYSPDNSVLFKDCGIGNDPSASSMQNVAGELSAVMRAAVWLRKNNIFGAVVHHDYIGIQNWINGVWDASAEYTRIYKDFISKYVDAGIIHSFRKVKSNSTDIRTSDVDILVKSAFNVAA